MQHSGTESLEDDRTEAIRSRPFEGSERLDAFFDTVSIDPATPGVIDVYFAPEELPIPFPIGGFLSSIGKMGVDHFHSCFFRCAICSITVLKNTLLHLSIFTEGFFKLGNLLICRVIRNEPPPVNPFDFPTMSLEFTSSSVIIAPCVSCLSYRFWGEAPPLL